MQTAEYLLSPAYQNVLREHQRTALARTNAAILRAGRKREKAAVYAEEADALRRELRRRHWAAIEAKIERQQTGVDSVAAGKQPELKTTVEYP